MGMGSYELMIKGENKEKVNRKFAKSGSVNRWEKDTGDWGVVYSLN